MEKELETPDDPWITVDEGILGLREITMQTRHIIAY